MSLNIKQEKKTWIVVNMLYRLLNEIQSQYANENQSQLVNEIQSQNALIQQIIHKVKSCYIKDIAK